MACRPRKRGRRKGRAPADAHGPRAAKKARGRTTGAAEITRPSLREGFNAYTCSPRGPALLPPSVAMLITDITTLAPAPGRQDHTISPSAPCRSSACENMLRHAASIASHLASRDDRDTPLVPRWYVADKATDLGWKSRIILIIGIQNRLNAADGARGVEALQPSAGRLPFHPGRPSRHSSDRLAPP